MAQAHPDRPSPYLQLRATLAAIVAPRLTTPSSASLTHVAHQTRLRGQCLSLHPMA